MPMAKKAGPGGDLRQDGLLRPVAAVAQDLMAALAVGNPVRAHRCAAGEHFLVHDIALQRRTLVAAVLRRPAHADVAAIAALAAEVRIEGRPGVAAGCERARCDFLRDKRPHFAAQSLRSRRQLNRLKPEFVHPSSGNFCCAGRQLALRFPARCFLDQAV
jgi:hypothetical protein